jgi:hypothetical protein
MTSTTTLPSQADIEALHAATAEHAATLEAVERRIQVAPTGDLIGLAEVRERAAADFHSALGALVDARTRRMAGLGIGGRP